MLLNRAGILFLLLLSPSPAFAASCCGGASATDPFVLPKWNKGMIGASIQSEIDFDQRLNNGDRSGASSWRSYEQRLFMGGAYRVHKNVQMAASVPLVFHTVSINQDRSFGAGAGDIGLQLRYELLDEETCVIVPFKELNWHDLKPSIQWTLKQLFPSGRSPGQARDALGASVTGQGYWVTETGIDLTKIWGAIGNSLEVNGGYQVPSAAEPFGEAAVRFRVGGSLLFYPAYQRFLGLNMTHQQERWRDSANSKRTSTSAGVIGSYIIKKSGIWLRGAVSTTGLIQGRNSPVGLLTNFFVAKLF